MILRGLKGLCESRKGTAFLLTLTISSVAMFCGQLGGTNYACIVATIFGVFTASHAAQTIMVAKPQGPPPP